MKTEPINRLTALEAVLAAGRMSVAIPVQAPAAAAKRATRLAEQQALVAVDRNAAALLGRLLILRLSQGTPIYQLAACSAHDDVADIAVGLAHASAVLAGRTLLVRADAPLMGRCHAMPSDKPLSDAFLPGLYHFKIDSGVAAGALSDDISGPDGLVALAGQFRVVVVQSSNFAASIALAPLCTGTVLVVRAGRTQVASVRAATASISAAGGRVLGTVLGGLVKPLVTR